MPVKTILFIVSGMGLGNSTRCDAVIDPLKRRGYRIEVVTSKNGARYFANDSRIDRLHPCEPLDYAGEGTQIDVAGTWRNLPRLLRGYRKNVHHLAQLIDEGNYSAIVIDSDYSIAPIKKRFSGLVVALNNAESLFAEPGRLLGLSGPHRSQMLVELLDYFFHRIVPDVVLSPTLSPQMGWKGNLKRIAPVVRGVTRGAKRIPSSPTRILILCGGSRFASPFTGVESLVNWKQTRVDILGRQGKNQGAIHYHAFTRNLSLLRQSDLMVINGGFSSVSEAVVYQKPCVIIPLPGHAEQYLNAQTLQQTGLGLIATNENWIEVLKELSERRLEFAQSHRKFNCPKNGAEEAALTIHERIEAGFKRAGRSFLPSGFSRPSSSFIAS